MNRYYSNTYWHFTGSPEGIDWQNIYKPGDILKGNNKPKSDYKCVKIIIEIIKSKKLIARCNEKIGDGISTDKFCCVTDIPIQNLEEQTKYYGKAAIGFNFKKIQKDFNPVLYYPQKLLPKRLKMAVLARAAMAELSLDKLINELGQYSPLHGLDAPRSIEEIDKKVVSYFKNHIKITEFSPNGEETFYREREWRKISDFNFEISDIDAVIVPHKMYEFLNSKLQSMKIKQIPILTWELLNKM